MAAGPSWAWVLGTVATTAALVTVGSRWWGRSPGALESTLLITGTPSFVVVERAEGQRWVVARASDEATSGSVTIAVER